MNEGELSILFLDLDGVLNSARTATVHGGVQEPGGQNVGQGLPHELDSANMAKFDPVAIGLIRAVVYETGCKIVISSSWRKLGYTVQEFTDAFGFPVIDFTPVLADKRGWEIKAWMDAHPEVVHYAILDDDGDMLPPQSDHFVQTSGYDGVLYSHYTSLKRILKGELGGNHRRKLTWEDDPSEVECEPS